MSSETLHLEIHREKSGEKVVEARSFDQPVVRIGRLAKVNGEVNDIVLKGGAVSGLHAKILFERGSVTVVDCSRNGTFVNGKLLKSSKLLVAGEEIKIAAATIRWRVEEVLDISPEEVLDISSEEVEGERRDLVPKDPMLPDLRFENLVGSSDAGTAGESRRVPEIAIAPPPGEPRRRARVPTGPLPVISLEGPAVDAPRGEHVLCAGRTSTSELAAAYRALAKEFEAPRWGRPPRADASDLDCARDAARRVLDGSGVDDGHPWTDWLAHEICGLDPVRALLDDSRVVGIVVQGEDPIRVLGASSWEVAPQRFSCIEAVFAAIERWTDRRLEDHLIERVEGDLTIRAFGGGIAPMGPVLTVQRNSRGESKETGIANTGRGGVSVDDLVALEVLSPAAAELLRGAVAASASILVYGDALVDPSIVLQALWSGLSEEAVVAVIRRMSQWSPKHAFVIDGRVRSAEEVWRCVLSVSPEWLFIEEVGFADAPPLCTYARHRGGGTVAVVRAMAGAAALGRIAASLAASLGSSAAACQAVVAESFDLVVGLASRANGTPRLTSIAEVRSEGDLAELFSWRPETSTLERTAIDPAILRGGG